MLRTAAVVRLLLHDALRVDEACAAGIADLGEDSGHLDHIERGGLVAVNGLLARHGAGPV